MKILDIDLDYFMDTVASFIDEDSSLRLDEECYGESVWSETQVRDFLENNLGLSKERKIQGRVVRGHNESLIFWKELISNRVLSTPFEVVHVDSHADLGLGYSSVEHITNYLLSYPVEERPMHNKYVRRNGKLAEEGIGDYLLWAIAYRWISKITYCGNPNETPNDYDWRTLKNFSEKNIWYEPVENTIQLLYNVNGLPQPNFDDNNRIKTNYFNQCVKEPEVPLLIIPTIEVVSFNGDFDYAVMAQSPNYTPASADFILDIFKEYIEEI